MRARELRNLIGSGLFAPACAALIAFPGAPGNARAAKPATPAMHVVTIEAMRFNPETIEVRAGDMVTWKNADPFPHTVTAQGSGFDSMEIAPGQSWRFQPMRNGSFPYVCTLHPTMKGMLIVK